MAVKEKKDISKLLPSIEILIVLVFFVSFVLVMLPRCERKQEELQTKAKQEAIPTTVILDSIAPTPPPKTPSLKLTSPATVTKRTVLYVTITGMNLREKPTLSSTIIQKMPLYEQVYFMDEITEFTQKLDLFEGYSTDEPWIKIQTKEGRIGWLYGAGVHFYRKKFELETKEATEPEVAN